MFATRIAAGLTVLAILLGTTPALAAKINIGFSWTYDRIRPEPQKGVNANNNFEVNLGATGSISEDQKRSAGRFSDGYQRKAKLGDGQWQVIGENQLRRILNAPQSTLTMIITTTGNTCKLDVKYALKPGFTEYKFPRITDQSWAFFTEPNITATRCSIKD